MKQREKIKIAYVVGSLAYGGAENQVIKLLNGINGKSYEKHLVTFNQEKNGQGVNLGLEIKRYNLNWQGFGRLFGILKMAFYFARNNIDIVQSHMYHANLYASIAAKMAGVSVIITTEHGRNTWKKPYHHLIERSIINPLVSMRVCVSRDVRELRVAVDHFPEEKCIVIQNSVDIPALVEKASGNNELLIGTVGRLVPAKDYGTLLNAASIVLNKRKNVKVIIVGDGAEKEMLQSMALKKGIADRVEFTGWQPDVNKYLEKMDIFVLSSVSEGIPIALLEAMAKRLPIVSTRVGGIPEVLENNVEGILVEPKDPEALAQALTTLIDNKEYREKLGTSAREKIIHSFSIGSLCRRYENFYENLLGGNSHEL